jgi:hypothetical protein
MYESVSDRLIREAMERGEFDDLPGAGKPIRGLDKPYDPNWWVKSLIERERSHDARRAEYEQIEARLGTVWALMAEAAVRRTVERLNVKIDELDEGQGRFAPFDVDDVVAAWKSVARARLRSDTPR